MICTMYKLVEIMAMICFRLHVCSLVALHWEPILSNHVEVASNQNCPNVVVTILFLVSMSVTQRYTFIRVLPLYICSYNKLFSLLHEQKFKIPMADATCNGAAALLVVVISHHHYYLH